MSSSPASPPPVLLSPADVGQAEATAAASAVVGGWFAPAGPELAAFESELARRVGREHGVATSSGTAALHLALVAAGVRPGDRVVTATFTFAATVNAVLMAGAVPVLVDCDPTTGDLDPVLVERALHEARRDGTPVTAVVPVDTYGRVTDHARLLPLAECFGAAVVSDAAESLGSTRDGLAGAAVGRAAAVSFNGNKIISTSGGGMLVTDDADLAARARRLAAQAREPVSHYLHHEPGYNHRLSGVLAAVGRVQLSRLDDLVARRRAVRARYREALVDLDGVSLLADHDSRGDNCWLTTIVLDPGRTVGPERLRLRLAEAGVESRRVWNPMHRQPAFAHHPAYLTGAADDLFARGLNLPSGSSLSAAQQDRVVAVVREEVHGDRA